MDFTLPFRVVAEARPWRGRSLRDFEYRDEITVNIPDGPAPVALRMRHRLDPNSAADEIRWADGCFWKDTGTAAIPSSREVQSTLSGERHVPADLPTVESAIERKITHRPLNYIYAQSAAVKRVRTQASYYRVIGGNLWEKTPEPFWSVEPAGSCAYLRLRCEVGHGVMTKWNFGLLETKIAAAEARRYLSGDNQPIYQSHDVEVVLPHVLKLNTRLEVASQGSRRVVRELKEALNNLHKKGDPAILRALLAPIGRVICGILENEEFSNSERAHVLDALINPPEE